MSRSHAPGKRRTAMIDYLVGAALLVWHLARIAISDRAEFAA
jgi:hypothetical protein